MKAARAGHAVYPQRDTAEPRPAHDQLPAQPTAVSSKKSSKQSHCKDKLHILPTRAVLDEDKRGAVLNSCETISLLWQELNPLQHFNFMIFFFFSPPPEENWNKWFTDPTLHFYLRSAEINSSWAVRWLRARSEGWDAAAVLDTAPRDAREQRAPSWWSTSARERRGPLSLYPSVSLQPPRFVRIGFFWGHLWVRLEWVTLRGARYLKAPTLKWGRNSHQIPPILLQVSPSATPSCGRSEGRLPAPCLRGAASHGAV